MFNVINRTPARLFLSNGNEIESAEGTTQGCPLAMPFYGISVKPIITKLRQAVPNVFQVWLADDATGAGNLNELKKWWDLIVKEGEKFGYFVKPSKSWLILKNPEKLNETKALFESSPINITTAGKRHLGASLGSNDFKQEYIDEKVQKWCGRIQKLSEIAKSQPHVAYAAYIHGEQHRYTYFARTIMDINNNLEPLDKIIDDAFIPALFGRIISDQERELMTLPVKEGGLGLRSIHKNAKRNYETSRKITTPLINKIKQQSDDLPTKEIVDKSRLTTMSKVREAEDKEMTAIKSRQSAVQQRTLLENSEPGASSWLGALPIAAHGFNLNKGEFQDALCLRYNFEIKNQPIKCPCGSKFNTTHALNCTKGGFIHARHDQLRDMESKLLQIVCRDVECEPSLQVMEENVKRTFQRSANVADDARLDVRARGFWRHGQNAFFDVRVTNINCHSQRNTQISTILSNHELEKKRQYNRRVMEIEQGSFTPLVFTTTGVMGYECSKYHKALAQKLSEKKGEKYEDIMRYLRVKISFLALKSTLLCLRGSRSTFKNIEVAEDFAYTLDELGM